VQGTVLSRSVSCRAVKYSVPVVFGTSVLPVSVEAKLSFVEPGRRWAHSPSPSKAPVRYYENPREDVTNLRRALTVIGCFFLLPQVLPLGA